MANKKPKPKPLPSPRRGVDLWICLLLLAAVLVTYSQVLKFDFVTFDDPDYVTENPHVLAGLSLTGVRWALGTSFAGNWLPLTWLSHMLDCQLFGTDSGWHHFTNVLLHAFSSMLWFAVLKRMTGARWKSALVALLFALHPLHVESVAWIAERKDVLSGLFWVLTLWAYTRYVAQPARGSYALTLVLFAFGLMAKPMLVTLPLVLLLFDRWPFERGFRIVEKIPFFVMSIAASVVAYVVHREAGAAVSFDLIPPVMRLENSLISYAVYGFQMLWPANLAVFYPYPSGSLLAPAIVVGVALAGVSLFVVRALPKRPYLAIGWFWYLVTLLPVIGLIQVGSQAHADRYTYIPMIGLFVALVWGSAEILTPWPRIGTAAGVAVCSVCLVLTWLQLQHWQNSMTLYQHAIDVTSDNYLARYNLAAVLETAGKPSDAAAQLRETVRIRPRFALAHSELGQVLTKLGLPEEAAAELQTAVTLKPENADAQFRLGGVLGSLGRIDEATVAFSQGFRLQPDDADAHYNFGIALAQAGRMETATREFRAIVRLRPDDVEARYNLGIALSRLGQLDESAVQLSEAVRLNPTVNEARQALEDVLKMKRQRDKQ